MFFVNDGGKTVHCFTVKQGVFDTVDENGNIRKADTVIFIGFQAGKHMKGAADKFTDIRKDGLNNAHHITGRGQEGKFGHDACCAFRIHNDGVITVKERMLKYVTQAKTAVCSVEHRGRQQLVRVVRVDDIEIFYGGLRNALRMVTDHLH